MYEIIVSHNLSQALSMKNMKPLNYTGCVVKGVDSMLKQCTNRYVHKHADLIFFTLFNIIMEIEII